MNFAIPVCCVSIFSLCCSVILFWDFAIHIDDTFCYAMKPEVVIVEADMDKCLDSEVVTII